MFTVKRSEANPLLQPKKENPWESVAAFNGCPVFDSGKTYLFYRALADHERFGNTNFSMSIIGRAESKDGEHFTKRTPFIVPEYEWERYGCEDPRVTKFKGTYYIFYTALAHFPFSAEGIRSAVAVTKDLSQVGEKHLVTLFNSKAMSLFPEKVNGKMTVILTANSDLPPSKIAIAQFDKPEDMWNPEFWNKWYSELDKHSINLKRDDVDHVEVGGAPIRTSEGWLLVYSHIQNYLSPDKPKVFGIEAVLLDLDNPRKIIARTRYPFLVPEETYEKFGIVPNIVFPSGAIIRGKMLDIYYGGADTVCAKASVNLADLLASMKPNAESKWVKRSPANPILIPSKKNKWESRAVFNPTAIDLAGKIHVIYRAMSEDNTSYMGYFSSKNGLDIAEKLDQPIYVPRGKAEMKLVLPSGNSGCEDARIMKFDDRLYITYTAYNGVDAPAVAISSISEKDFLAKQWNWSEPQLISPPGVDDKDACILPEKINGKYMVIHRIAHHICADFVDTLDFSKQKLTKCIQMLGPRYGMWDSKKVGLASVPFKTKRGWVMFYHGIGEDGHYRLGAALYDLKDPTQLISRTATFLMEPVTKYELNGQVGNVVFPCGTVIRKGIIYIYYGGGDSVIGVATMKLDDLLSIFPKT